MLKDETVYINGDGETSRDFCYIDNVTGHSRPLFSSR